MWKGVHDAENVSKKAFGPVKILDLMGAVLCHNGRHVRNMGRSVSSVCSAEVGGKVGGNT